MDNSTDIIGETKFHSSQPREKVDTSLYKKNEEEKKRIKDLKKAHKNSLK